VLKSVLKFLGLGDKKGAAGERIDVRRLMEQYTVEEFNQASEQYFRQRANNPTFYLKKPLGQPTEAGPQLVFFAEMLSGLKPLPGMKVLDFGAATCWSSRYLADFKLKVLACDVSPTALEIGRQRFTRNPPVDPLFKPEFMVFNGRRLDLADASIDRITCFDAFHHVPNPREVLREFARVLKPGGIVGFSEPGPRHSLTAQSQFEMKHHRIVQNGIDLNELWPWAKEAGFTDIKVAVCNAAPFTVGLKEFNTLIRRGGGPLRAYAKHVRRRAADRRLFFLQKGEALVTDSRDRAGLLCEMNVELMASRVRPHGWVEGRAMVRNTGRSRWLPSSALFGPVKLGVHLRTQAGQPLNHDYARVPMPSSQGVEPGESIAIPFRFPAPGQVGDYLLEFDMVSEEVCWFEANGAKVPAMPLRVE
jgi:ubiquinone/menaquinone biosynthesis C-methylase UbiE